MMRAGYVPAEEPGKYHGVAPYWVEPAVPEKKTSNSAVAGQTLKPGPSSRTWRRYRGHAERIAGRFGNCAVFDVGIAEEHAVTMAAGQPAGASVLRCIHVLQRGYDQLIHDSLQKLGVTLLIDRRAWWARTASHQACLILPCCFPAHMTLLSRHTDQLRMINLPRGIKRRWRLPRTPLRKATLLDDTPLFSWTVKHMAR
ncbi:MAG: hypothetical protein ACLUO4_06820 [Christensenellales bacterium]